MRTIFTFILAFASILSVRAQSADSLYLMPRPQSVKLQSGRFLFTDKFAVAIDGPNSAKLTAAVNRFYQQSAKHTGIIFPQEYIATTDNDANAQMVVRYSKTITPKIGMDESYSLSITASKITLNAANDIGALRGLETLYQLEMNYSGGYYCPVVEIADNPRFKWRGMMIDVARHFIPFDVLKRNVDAMAMVKMNVLHLHLSDDEGFRVESEAYPELQNKGSNGLYYTQNQIKELVSYAHNRGIIVVPEFDLPGHCTSMLAAYPFLASYPSNYKPAKRFSLDTVKNLSIMKVMKLINEVPTPTIDPTKETTYTFFDRFIKEMSGLFTDAYFHVGADENNGVAWKQNPAITEYMKAHSMKTTDELQAYFVKRMYAIAKKYNKQLIGWEETFNEDLPKDAIVQKWKPIADEQLANKVIKHGNQLLVSSGFYLDFSMPAYIHYLNEPVPANVTLADADKGILGGEAAIWSELVNGENEELRVWPRAAVIAERLWSVANVKDIDDMYRRLWMTDFELNDLGLEENSNYTKMIARWANGADAAPIKTLTDICTPIRGYKRLMDPIYAPATTHPNLASPMVNIADAVKCDSEPRWHFRKLVSSYLANHDSVSLKQIKAQLNVWKNNRWKLNLLAANNPYLKQLKDLSGNLYTSANIGLQALDAAANKDDLLKQLQQIQKPVHEVELAIMPEMEALITGKLKDEPATYPLF